MYVRKFEGDSLDETLKAIKAELGPDAVILKTVTNKGLKGAFKKKKIEITAAISEKSYTKKAKVDHILDEKQKDDFYSAPASFVSNMIDQHTEYESPNTNSVVKNPGYGDIGLNKKVQTAKEFNLAPKRNLDDFLQAPKSEVNEPTPYSFIPKETPIPVKPQVQVMEEPQVISTRVAHEEIYSEKPFGNSENSEKIDELERKLFELTKSVEKIELSEPQGIYELRTTLRSFNISEKYIQIVIKKAFFEFSEADLQSPDLVFEFALREMSKEINVSMPKFSTADIEKGGVVTVLLSENSTGQTSMIYKLGSLTANSVIIQKNNGPSLGGGPSVSEKLFDLEVRSVNSVAEVIGECRKALDENKNVFVDFKVSNQDTNDVKKFVESLNRSFENIEILISLSGIHSELYNRKVLNTYQSVSNGIVISNIDLCLNFGSIFNLQILDTALPFMFFGTGEVIPDDIESATAERILAGIFNFN